MGHILHVSRERFGFQFALRTIRQLDSDSLVTRGSTRDARLVAVRPRAPAYMSNFAWLLRHLTTFPEGEPFVSILTWKILSYFPFGCALQHFCFLHGEIIRSRNCFVVEMFEFQRVSTILILSNVFTLDTSCQGRRTFACEVKSCHKTPKMRFKTHMLKESKRILFLKKKIPHNVSCSYFTIKVILIYFSLA